MSQEANESSQEQSKSEPINAQLNSSPIDELGNWCQESLVGRGRARMRYSREVSMATL